MDLLLVAEDRGMTVPQSAVVKTGYVAVEAVSLKCRDRMAVGDVQSAMSRRMAAAPGQPWPCPVGEWDGERFYISDGRHEYIAALMLGCTHILVAWIDPAAGVV